jgi:hypothetical protein
MQRKIVDHSKLSPELLELLVQTYPYGYDDSDTIRFQNAKGEKVECLEIKTDDTVYLVKVSKHLATAMDEFDADDDDNDIPDTDVIEVEEVDEDDDVDDED